MGGAPLAESLSDGILIREDSVGEGLIHHVRDETWKIKNRGKPDEERVLDDPGVPDKRLLVIESEMARMLKAMNRDGNPLSDVRILQDRDRLLAIMKDGSFHKKPAGERRAARVAAE